MVPRPTPPIRPMADGELAEVLAVTARAFWHDPLFDFFARDLLHEHHLLPALFRAYLGDVQGPQGEVWVAEHDGRPRAVAGWLAPGGHPRPAGREAALAGRAALAVARARNRRKAVRLLLEIDRHHPSEPHWYLSVLATDPALQGRGIGTALLDPVLARCDAEGLPAYLETQKEANVAWYGRAGFEVSAEVRLPGTPPVWCLRREPRELTSP